MLHLPIKSAKHFFAPFVERTNERLATFLATKCRERKGKTTMNDTDSKNAEEIEAALAIKYNFTVENWARKPTRNDLEDMDYLISRLKEQDREIERRLDRSVQLMAEKHYQRRHREWALKQCRTWQRFFCFYKDDAVRFHSDRADKAEARVAEVEDLRYQSFKETRKHCDKWQQDRKDLMQNIPGYQYKNRVDDPEWGKAKKILLSLLAEKEKV